MGCRQYQGRHLRELFIREHLALLGLFGAPKKRKKQLRENTEEIANDYLTQTSLFYILTNTAAMDYIFSIEKRQ